MSHIVYMSVKSLFFSVYGIYIYIYIYKMSFSNHVFIILCKICHAFSYGERSLPFC